MKQLNWYQIFGKSNIPDGRTVLPTDDIQIWLHCANIWDKSYTTLAEVLADTDTLLALITNNNAVDYMVRSTTWASATALVPKMTSNTTPEGVCSASSVYSSTYPAWKAFDEDDSTEWLGANNTFPSRVQYTFTTSKLVSGVLLKCRGFDGGTYPNSAPGDIEIKGSNDNGSTWTTLKTYEYPSNGAVENGTKFLDLTDNVTEYTTICVNILNSRTDSASKTTSGYTGFKTIQFYTASVVNSATAMTYIGQNNYCANTLLADATWCEAICNSTYFESVLNVKVPTMTDNTHPSGVCSSTALQSGSAYYAFDKNASTNIVFNNRQGRIIYKFPEAVDIYLMKVTPRAGLNPPQSMLKSCTVDHSADGNTWDNIASITVANSVTEQTFLLNKTNDLYFSLYATGDVWDTGINNSGVTELNFYGRKDI